MTEKKLKLAEINQKEQKKLKEARKKTKRKFAKTGFLSF